MRISTPTVVAFAPDAIDPRMSPRRQMTTERSA